jgi:folylpolyglutamate synthase/dihydropteroate synthase
MESRYALNCYQRLIAGLSVIISGLYTSPHLVAVRERIRINGTPISEEDFSKFFFQVWDKLGQSKVTESYLQVQKF